MENRNYKNGKIYCIKNYITDDVYVGSTTQPLSKRMDKHRAKFRQAKYKNNQLYKIMNDIGLEHFYIQLIEKCECNDVEELRAVEKDWIKNIGNLNVRVDGRTKSEYYIDKKEHINKTNSENYYKNREERLKQQKDYASNHKEEKREYDKNRREEKREEISEYNKEKYANNPEYQQRQKENSNNRYNEKKTEIRAKMNTKHLCECGKEYSYGNRLRHFNSQFHQNFLNNNINNVQKKKTNTNEI